MIDSACGLDPSDMSDAAKNKRRIDGLSKLDGIDFIAKIGVEPSRDPKYSDRNVLDRPILPDEKEWKMVKDGQSVPPSPSRHRAAPAQTQGNQPAWSQGNAASPPAPSWQQQSPPTSAPATSAPAPAKAEGPAWLKD
jgi:hypothetical protein